MGINVGQQFTGQGSLVMYSTMLYQKVFKGNKEIQLVNALNGTFGILFTLNATWMADRFGCRALLLYRGSEYGGMHVHRRGRGDRTPTLPDGAKSRPIGIATVFLMFLFAFFYKPSWALRCGSGRLRSFP